MSQLLEKIQTAETFSNTIDALNDYKDGLINLDRVWQVACLDLARQVNCTRTSVWIFNKLQDRIDCLALYDDRFGHFESGARLQEEDFPTYFQAIRTGQTVIAVDAMSHPYTAEFAHSYFEPNSIDSLLDHIVMSNGMPVAVICCEHCGGLMSWTPYQERSLIQASELLAEAFKVAKANHSSRF